MGRRTDGPEHEARLAKRLAERRTASRFVAETLDVAALFDELELHQIELEMQNEDLLAARAESESALALYAELYDFAPVGYFTLGPQATIERGNILGAQLLGVDRARLVGRRLGAFVASSSLPDFNAALSEALAGGQRSCEVALTGAQQDEREARWVQLTFSAGGPNTVRAVAVDVTERRRMAEQLRTSQKMEAVGRLAGGVAHDFNNLLTVIIAGAENARMEAPEGTLIEEDLQLVIDAAQRAAGLTRKLLAFGRRQLLRPQVVDVNLLIGDLAKLLRTLLGERSQLVMQLEPGLRAIEIDPIQLEQVIVNLVVNARDAMPDGGKLMIATRDAQVTAQAPQHAVPPGSYVLVTVSDTGVGMPPEVMSHIFEPFFTTKAREQGTGLGLASVAGIVEQSGGTIVVHSKPGAGTTFEVYLPRTPGTSAIAPSAKVTTVARGGKETIMVVDDEEGLRCIAERILAAAGYTVLVAGSGAEALDVLAQHAGPVHLLLSDVIMPGMTGPELAQRVRAASPETKVLFMSGYADDILGRAGVLESETCFVAKPYSVQGLRVKVREALD